MKVNWRNGLATGVFLAGGLFLGYSQDQIKTKENSSFVDSIMTEAEKYSTTTHFFYEMNKENKFNFHDVNKLEKIIGSVEKQCEKKEKYSREEAIEILKITGKEIKNLGLEYELNKFDCDDMSRIYLAVGEKFNLPLYGVSIPFHFFIRYDQDGKHNSLDSNDSVNKGDFNWEPTNIPQIKSDEYYLDFIKDLKSDSIKRPIKSLTRQGLITHAYYLRAMNNPQATGWFINEWVYSGTNYNIMIQDFEILTKLDSAYQNGLAQNYYKRGEMFLSAGYCDSAIKDFEKAKELVPNGYYSYYFNERSYKDIKNLKRDCEIYLRKFEELQNSKKE